MTITSGGNVGIGATDPAAKLHVAGPALPGGNVTVAQGALSTVVGSGFLASVHVGDAVKIGTEKRPVVAITDDQHLTVGFAFAGLHSGEPMTVYPSILRVDDASGATRLLIDDRGGQFNQIVFLTPLGGGQDDRPQIQAAIDNLPAAGGIIYLMPDPANNPFRISRVIVDPYDPDKSYGILINKHGVKLRGYGGSVDATWPLTRLYWTETAALGGTVVLVTPPSGYDHVQDVELSDLFIDGNRNDGPPPTGATIGLKLNRAQHSRFVKVRVENINISSGSNPPDGMGILLCTDVAANVEFNYFESCTGKAPRALVLDGNEAANSNMNMFVNLRLHYRGTDVNDAGIWLKHAGDNSFFRVSIFNDFQYDPQHPEITRQGHGVVVEKPDAAMGNCFYHLIPARGVYVRQSTRPLPAEGRMMLYSSPVGADDLPQTDSSDAPPEKLIFWADTRGEMHGTPNLNLGAAYIAWSTVSTNSSTSVTGIQSGPNASRFELDVEAGDRVTVIRVTDGERQEIATRTVESVDSYYQLTVDQAFPTTESNLLMQVTKGQLSTGADVSVGGALKMGITEVISDQRVLHNVTADAGILPLASDTARGAVTMSTSNSSVACATDDTRLSDARQPTAHASSHVSGGADPLQNLAPSQVAGTAVITSDSRLSDARTPTPHHTSHEVGGSDVVQSSPVLVNVAGTPTLYGKRFACGVSQLSSGSCSAATGLTSIDAAVAVLVYGAAPGAQTLACHNNGGTLEIYSSDTGSSYYVWWIAIGV